LTFPLCRATIAVSQSSVYENDASGLPSIDPLAPVLVGLVLSVVACVRIRAQGVLQFENMSVMIHLAPIYNTDTCLCAKSGNSMHGIPMAARPTPARNLSGSGFTIELWAAPSDAPDSAWCPWHRQHSKPALRWHIFPVNVSVPPLRLAAHSVPSPRLE